MEDSYGWASTRNEEFQEEDVWAIYKERKDFTSMVGSSDQVSTITPRRLPNAARMIPRANKNAPPQEPKMAQQSAPVNVPDWSKIYGKSSKKASKTVSWLDDNDDDDDGYPHMAMRGRWENDEADDDDDDSDGTMMPPHEWIARKLARSQISSFSVCEGAGRTLKGRDLSRVRNTVLTRTGFLE